MCSEPVTLGGGTAITNGSPGSSGSTANAPRLAPAREHRGLDRGGVVARLGLEALAGGGVHPRGILGPGRWARCGCAAQRRDQLEEPLGRDLAADAPDAAGAGARPDRGPAACAEPRRASSRRSRKRRSAASSASLRPLTSQAGRLRRRGGSAAADGCDDALRRPRLAHDDRAGREVAEALVVAAREDRDRAHQVERPGATSTRRTMLRSALARNVTGEPSVADDAQAAPALAGRASRRRRSSNATG